MTTIPLRLPDPTSVYDPNYMNQLLKVLRSNTSGQTTVITNLQTQIDTINEILARHHIT